MASYNSMFNMTAQSILNSDRAKGAPLGQKYQHVQFVEVTGGEDEPPFLVVKSGAHKAEWPIATKALIRPEKREMRPADMHDAVLAAFIGAQADLAITIEAAAEAAPGQAGGDPMAVN